MKVLIVTPIYLPEQAPISYLLSDFVEGLFRRGHDVQVVTGAASWLVEDGPEVVDLDFFVEIKSNCKIYRLPFLKSESNRLFGKMLGYFFLRFFTYRYRKQLDKPDIIYAPVPSNETGMSARALSRYFNCPYIINVQDIHPDAMFSLGIVKNRLLKMLLNNQEKKMYAGAAQVTVIGESFRRNLTRKGVAAPISVIPNWIEPADYEVINKTGLAKEWGIGDEDFVVLYSGTFGRIHGTSIIIDAAERLLHRNNLIFLLVGHGIDFDLLQEQVVKRRLHNVVMRDYVPRSKLAELQSLATVSLVTTRAKLGYSSIPSKVLGYMAASRPVIAMTEIDSDVGRLVEAAKCGVVLPPEDLDSLVRIISQYLANKGRLLKWGENGREYLCSSLNKQVLVDQLVSIVENTHDCESAT